jgi:hypothetical protein
MHRAYPPNWCKHDDCTNCDFKECNSRALALFEPYRYPELDMQTRPKAIEITTIAIYFGYCQRLAKYFLLYPQYSPISVVKANFFNNFTGLPTNVEIQRIFLDMINRGDPNAPTDEVHKFRLILIQQTLRGKKAYLHYGNKRVEVDLSEREKFLEKVGRWQQNLKTGKLTFKKTDNKKRCEYCFLPSCDNI